MSHVGINLRKISPWRTLGIKLESTGNLPPIATNWVQDRRNVFCVTLDLSASRGVARPRPLNLNDLRAHLSSQFGRERLCDNRSAGNDTYALQWSERFIDERFAEHLGTSVRALPGKSAETPLPFCGRGTCTAAGDRPGADPYQRCTAWTDRHSLDRFFLQASARTPSCGSMLRVLASDESVAPKTSRMGCCS